MKVDYDGLWWQVDDGSHDHLGPSHEESLTPTVLDLLPEGGVFLDVGAHVGHYTLRAARKASMVIAVEANPDTAARLRWNLSLNTMGNVHVVNVAAWNGVGRFRIQKVHEQYERDGSNRILPDPDGPVWGARLDDALNCYPLRPDRLDVIKLDVEGADIPALEGMSGLIGKYHPVLFIEDHSCYGYYEQADLLALLTRLGYRWEDVDWCGAHYWIARPEQAPSTPAGPS